MSLDISDLPPFEAPFPLRDGRLMTLASTLPRRGSAAFASSGEVRLFDVGQGSRVQAHCHWQRDRRGAPAALVLHGLTGSSSSHYAVGVGAKLFDAGFSVVRLNARNCGDTEALSTTIYHAALYSDPLRVLQELVRDPGCERLYVVGFSMGANLALLMAGEEPDAVPAQVRGLAAVSPPLDLAECSRRCEADRFNRAVTRRFLGEFQRTFRRREECYPGRIDLDRLDPRMSLWDFDSTFTAPLAGFDSVDDYYAAGSALPRLAAIQIPTLLLHAADDPLIGSEPFRAARFERLPLFRSLLCPAGGHVAFIGRAPARGLYGPDRDRRWAENRVVDHFRQLEARTSPSDPTSLDSSS